MPSPLTSIIVLNWQRAEDTIRCLESLSNLTDSRHVILVVDNGSKDDSVARIQTAFPDIEILQTGRNLGFAGGCNTGIRKAMSLNADFVWLLNNDTEVNPDTLSCLVNTAQREPGIGAASSIVYHKEPPYDIQVWGGGRLDFWAGRCRQFKTPGKPDYLTGASMLLRREALQSIGLLDDRSFFMYWEDVDISLRLRRSGWSLAIANQSRIYHSESSSIRGRSDLQDYYFSQSSARFFRKHYRAWFWPLAITVATRTVKRLLKADFPAVRAIFTGTMTGLDRSNTKPV